MLVVPALLSLKPSVVIDCNHSFIGLLESVCQKLTDESPIVQKTARKLLLEIQRVYPDNMNQIFECFRDDELENRF